MRPIESRLRGRAQRAIAERHVLRYLSGATLLLSVSAGIGIYLIDRRDFATVGDAMWWALQTLSTVGYGDVVPHTAWGRVLGSLVIVLGITFLSVLTATITSAFVRAGQGDDGREDAETRRLLRDIDARLGAIEATLEREMQR